MTDRAIRRINLDPTHTESMKSLPIILSALTIASPFAMAGDKCDSASKTACATACDKDSSACDKEKMAGDCDKSACDGRDYLVSGMTCSSCSDALTAKLSEIEGVSAVSVCHKSGHAAVTADASKVSDEQIISTIKDAGYKVTGERVKVKLSSTQCSSCPTALSDKFIAMEGVTAVEGVCAESGTATVIIDLEKTNRAQVVAAISGEETAQG